MEVQDEQGRVLRRERVPKGIAGIRGFGELVGRFVDDDTGFPDVLVCIETDRGPWVQALLAAGYRLFGVDPKQAARHREILGSSRSKSDKGDAHALADMARTRRHQLREVAADSDLVEAVKVVTRAHQTLIWERTRHMLRLRAALRDYFPAALAIICGNAKIPRVQSHSFLFGQLPLSLKDPGYPAFIPKSVFGTCNIGAPLTGGRSCQDAAHCARSPNHHVSSTPTCSCATTCTRWTAKAGYGSNSTSTTSHPLRTSESAPIFAIQPPMQRAQCGSSRTACNLFPSNPCSGRIRWMSRRSSTTRHVNILSCNDAIFSRSTRRATRSSGA